ncbi:MAG: phenylacetate-CoA oxygenase subunit PaaC [Spongiibacteraceae bacterium]|nr:phenylacetate-CoA oxygenase subunit PaaC [Spongiibacteraceae bacterium]
MADNQNDPLMHYVLSLGDDALVIGQRLLEWCSKAPFLEEDLAISNTSLDFIGRARMFYSYAADLSGDDKTEDDFAFTRDCREFRNCLLYELPRGDFAFTYARQIFIDAYDCLFFDALASSRDERLAAIAAKVVKESRYHWRHSQQWLQRLGGGTQESHDRLQKAITQLADYTGELFEQDEKVVLLVAQGIAVKNAALKEPWYEMLSDRCKDATILLPPLDHWHQTGGRCGLHTEHLGHLLSELQFMQRAYPGLEW